MVANEGYHALFAFPSREVVFIEFEKGRQDEFAFAPFQLPLGQVLLGGVRELREGGLWGQDDQGRRGSKPSGNVNSDT